MNTEQRDSSPGLVRALGTWMAIAVVVGTVIGSGVFKKPQAVAENVPFTGLAALAWVLGGVLALLGALALAEVAVMYPRAGGNYVFLREGYGRLFGFLWGWVEFWIIKGASIAALSAIFSEQMHTVLREVLGTRGANVFPQWGQQLITISLILALALVNVRGVRWGGTLQLLITTVKVGSLLAIPVLPFVVWALLSPGEQAPLDATNLSPVWPPDETPGLFAGFTAALVGVLWAYHGWMNVAPVAGEVRNPQRTLPIALIVGVGIIIFLYLGANLAYGLVIPQDEMKLMRDAPGVEDRTVAIGFCRRLLGSAGVGVAAAAVMLSVFGAVNGLLLVTPRLLYAMGEDGLAPKPVAAVHPIYRTPAVATLVLAVWSVVLVLATAAVEGSSFLPPGKPLFDVLTDLAIFGAVTFETLAVATIFVFRFTRPDAERSYRCLGYPVVPAVYILVMAVVAAGMVITPQQRMESLAGLGFMGLGAVVYFLLYRRTTR
jgi:basic amino acid/polyamine antiporter, APA family